MRRPDSHARRRYRKGSLGPSRLQFRISTGSAKAPPTLREAAMGYTMMDTSAPGLTDHQRSSLLGNAIDQNLAIALIRAVGNRPPTICCMGCNTCRCQFDGLCDCLSCTTPLHPFPRVMVTSTEPSPHRLGDLPCSLCDSHEGETDMVICDGCNRGFHLHRLVPPRSLPPSGTFLCPECDPQFDNRVEELYNPATPWQYQSGDPFQDSALLRLVHFVTTPTGQSPVAARHLRNRAKRHRLHPTRPTFLQRSPPKAKTWITIPPLEYRLNQIRAAHDATRHSSARTTSEHLSRIFT